MKKLLLIAFLFISSFAFAQEYDDMYFTKKDRKRTKVNYESNRKHINPEYIARYTTKPKVKVYVESYHRPYRYNYNRWNWNITFGYSNWYHYDPFYSPFYSHYNYYPYYHSYYGGWNSFYYPPYYQPYYSWAWHRPYYGWNYPHYRYNYYYGHNYGYYNYGYVNTYHTKTYVTTHKNEVNYKKRRTRGSIHIPATNREVTKQRVTRDRTIHKPTRKTSSRIDWLNSPTKKYRSTRETNYQKNRSSNNSYRTTPKNNYTPRNSGSNSRSSYTPSRSSGSKSSYTPSRSNGGSRSSSSSSGSRGRRQ